MWEDPNVGVRDEQDDLRSLQEALSWARERSTDVFLNLREGLCWLGPGQSPVADATACTHPEHGGA